MTDALLIDGMNLIHRAQSALSASRQDVPAAEIVALTRRMIGGWVRRYDMGDQRTIVIFDGPQATARRRKLYPDYKSGRAGRPDALTEALPRLRDELHDLDRLRVLRLDGEEADDVIATYADLLGALRMTSVIVTSDRDLLQAIGPWTAVALPASKGREPDVIDLAAFQKRYDFGPRLLADYKAFVGDKSDNIAGVHGIGDKGARRLLADYPGVETIFEAIDGGYVVAGAAMMKILRDPATRVVARRNLAVTTLNRRVPGITLRGAAAQKEAAWANR